MRLKDRVAIVTGAARGIGKGYAEALAREGAKVCVADIDGATAKQTAQELEAAGGTAIAVTADVSKEEDALELARQTVEAFGGIDILFNNAAIFADDVAGYNPLRWDPIEGPLEQWHQMLGVNVTGVLLCTRAAVPHMKKRGKGKIINQASVGA